MLVLRNWISKFRDLISYDFLFLAKIHSSFLFYYLDFTEDIFP